MLIANAEKSLKECQKEKDALEIFKKDLGTFVRFYEFMSQIVDYDDIDLEKLSLYARNLRPMLRETLLEEDDIDLGNVVLSHYRVAKMRQQDLVLKENTGEHKLVPGEGLGTAKPQDKREEFLSQINDLYRHASGRVLSKQARTAVEYRKQHDEMRLIIHAEDTTADEKIEALKKLIPNDEPIAAIGHAALVRQSLTEDATKVTSLLNVFSDLEIKGDATQRPLRQVMALRELDAKGIKELPVDFDVSIVDPIWHEMLNDKDRGKALAALKAATMMSVRHGFRSSRLWIDHSWDYRNREDLLIPPAQWKKDRLRLISALSLNADPEKFLTRLNAHLEAGLQALSEALETG